MKFSSMEKIAIFANEATPFVLDSTIFWKFQQEAVWLSTYRYGSILMRVLVHYL